MTTGAAESTSPTVQYLPGTSNIPLTNFPAPEPIPDDVNPAAEVESIISRLNESFADPTIRGAEDLFVTQGYWRDHLMLSWSFRTVQGRAQIRQFLQQCAGSKDGFRLKHIAVDKSSPVRQPAVGPLDGEAKVLGISAFLSVESVVGNGEGLVRLAQEDGKWKIFTLYTSLRSLKDRVQDRPRGVKHGEQTGRQNWADRRSSAADYRDGSEPAVLVIGAGQAGLSVAARLTTQGVNTLIVDRNDRVGDNWRKRYHQLVLHDPVWYDHLPYLNFPQQWPVFTPKDKLAQWFEAYADIMELNVWMKTTLTQVSWSEIDKHWTVRLERTRADGSVENRVLHPRHIVQATGHSGEKNQPAIKGIDTFAGDRICHSSEFSGAQEASKGKRAVVVGSCNSALDIAQDFVEKGYDVTVVQRSSTHVVSSYGITDIALHGLYSEGGPPVEDADMIVHSMPNSMLKTIQVKVGELQRHHDRDMLEGLAKAGFKVDNGPDGAGVFFKYFQRGGGYYIDVGASKLIMDGKIKVKQGHEITEIVPHGLRFSDQSELAADEIVLATGYQSMKTHTRQIFGDKVAEQVKDVWGLNEEGEWRTIWQRSGHPGFWFHGGNLGLCRYYSQLLALQIQGLEENLYDYNEN